MEPTHVCSRYVLVISYLVGSLLACDMYYVHHYSDHIVHAKIARIVLRTFASHIRANVLR